VFAEVLPVSAFLAITEIEVTDQIDIQLAPEDIVDIKTCSSSRLHTLLFLASCCAFELTSVSNDDTTDAADSLTPDEPQFFSDGRLGAIEGNPTQSRLTTAARSEAVSEVFSLRARQQRRFIHRCHPVFGKQSKHAKRSFDTTGHKVSLSHSQRFYSAVQVLQTLSKSYA
jgi:hypothetical protein